MSSSSREYILNKVRVALKSAAELPEKPDLNKEIFSKPSEGTLLDFFKSNFIKTKGQLLLCENEQQLPALFEKLAKEQNFQSVFAWEENIVSLLNKTKIPFSTSEEEFVGAGVGIVSCDSLIARTGSIIFTSNTKSGRRLSIFPPISVVVAYTSQLKEDIIDGLKEVRKNHKELPSMISLATGPSRTADIEKTLVLGAHGPKELFLLLINDASL